MSKQSALPKIGYVVKMFPRLSETFILNEILELERRGIEVVIFSLKKPNEGRFHPQLADLKATVHYLEDLDSKKWFSWIGAKWPQLERHSDRIFSILGEMLKNESNGKIDHLWHASWIAAKAEEIGLTRLHAHFASLPSTIAYLAHSVSGIPFSFTAHAKDIFVYTPEEHHLREKLAAASFVVTVTEFNKRFLTGIAREVDPNRIRVIHNGVDLDQFKPNDKVNREDNLILTVGRLVYKKGFHDLLEACNILKKSGTKFKCMIVGEGPEETRLKEMHSALGLQEEVIFVGAKHLDEVRAMMDKATIFCLPCTTAADKNVDALPTVLLESLAAGLPIISTTVSGVPEIIDTGTDGYLVEPDDPATLAEKIAELLASPELRKIFSDNGRDKAIQKFDLKKNVELLLQTHIDADSLANDAKVVARQTKGAKI